MWPVSSMNEKSLLSVLKGTLTIDCWTYTQFSPAGSHKQNNGHLNNKDPKELCINVFSIWLPSHWSSSIMTNPASECISCSSWLMQIMPSLLETALNSSYCISFPCHALNWACGSQVHASISMPSTTCSTRAGMRATGQLTCGIVCVFFRFIFFHFGLRGWWYEGEFETVLESFLFTAVKLMIVNHPALHVRS